MWALGHCIKLSSGQSRRLLLLRKPAQHRQVCINTSWHRSLAPTRYRAERSVTCKGNIGLINIKAPTQRYLSTEGTNSTKSKKIWWHKVASAAQRVKQLSDRGAENPFVHTLVSLVKFGSLVYVINNYVFEVTMCIGPSMMPTFNSAGDLVLVEHISVLRNKLRTGDVVVAKSPTNPDQTVCKRIIGFEGSMIQASKRHRYDSKAKKVQVPPGHVWLEGDNKYNSTDSRHYGPVPLSMIKGRVFFKVWPLWEIGFVSRDR